MAVWLMLKVEGLANPAVESWKLRTTRLSIRRDMGGAKCSTSEDPQVSHVLVEGLTGIVALFGAASAGSG